MTDYPLVIENYKAVDSDLTTKIYSAFFNVHLPLEVAVRINYDAQTPNMCHICRITTTSGLTWDPEIKKRFYPDECNAQEWIKKNLIETATNMDNQAHDLKLEANHLSRKASTLRLKLHTGIG
jgi:hypothetical protein